MKKEVVPSRPLLKEAPAAFPLSQVAIPVQNCPTQVNQIFLPRDCKYHLLFHRSCPLGPLGPRLICGLNDVLGRQIRLYASGRLVTGCAGASAHPTVEKCSFRV